MLCDKYKEGLIEAAASGAALTNALREHVETCAHCGGTLAGERTLLAAVDAGLQKAANAKVRSCFLRNVKANLAAETVPTRNPIPGWAFVCATGALALASAFLSMPRGAYDNARTQAITVPSKVPAGAGGVELRFAPERKTRYAARPSKAPEQQNVSSTTSREPEVLIQPEEEEFLKRFYAAVGNPERDARAVVTDDHEVTPKPLVIEQIEVRDLNIENLDEESGLAQTGTK
jgi:hypothetical protein